jgi:sugar (pentulose or hexulose) kinase
MPELMDSGAARGRVHADVAGVPAPLVGAVVVAAGMDHLVAAVGATAAAPGDVWDSCGTAEAFVRSTGPLDSTSVLSAVKLGLTVGWHADPSHQVILGAQRSGYVFQRVLGLLGVGTAEDLQRFEAGAVPVGDSSATLSFDRLYDATYAIGGLTSRTRPQDVWAALVSRVAADGAALLRQADAVAGPHARVVMGGGWAASVWFQDAKRAHDPDIATTSIEQPGAEGAAVLASRALDG